MSLVWQTTNQWWRCILWHSVSWDRLIFNMRIPILVRRHLYIETSPRFSVIKRVTNSCFAGLIHTQMTRLFNSEYDAMYLTLNDICRKSAQMRQKFTYICACNGKTRDNNHIQIHLLQNSNKWASIGQIGWYILVKHGLLWRTVIIPYILWIWADH